MLTCLPVFFLLVIVRHFRVVDVVITPHETNPVLIVDANMYCPLRSPRNFSNLLPGKSFKSCSSSAASSTPSFRFVVSAGGEPGVLPVRQISSAVRFAKLLPEEQFTVR
jgi:hypothetical protein